MKTVTIKDLARSLNLSTSTISRALRGSSEIGVETKKRVLELAQRLDYNPNPVALSLLSSQTNDIGVIVPEIANPFFAIVIAGIEDVAFAQGYHVVIYQSHEDYEREVLNVKHIYNRRKDGLLVSVSTSTKDYAHFKTIHERGFPIVFFDRICEEIDTHNVSVDDFEGAYKATEHLIKQGCERIAHVSGPAHLLISRRRLHGYRAALLDYGRPIQDDWVVAAAYNTTSALVATRGLLAKPERPDGIFASSDNIAIGCHSAITEAGLTMPDDIALVGFSDLPMAALLNPPLSSVAQPAFEMGRSAAELLINLIRNPREHSTSISNVLKTSLVVRKSSLRGTAVVKNDE
ncbi:LacI family DNA-binding transcriptional regulator [Spirosoma radiotolerans]|uniref:LacI family transcriptional regulator n=1 Tax=Spirosoma radiotolerans TaxID=1379870 RepID=A0A0E3ZY76_9BACT|nr:LacI family DNA-binding transcriptional regulator [Spirosoma radiotolerans]AKD56813.1 LacI family transcriptional regulator [Spirosoma radiotolerans]